MVSYGEDREYITPEDIKAGDIMSGIIDLVSEKTNDNGKYYRVLIKTNIPGKDGMKYASMNLGDYITKANNHGLLVTAILGPAVIKKRTYQSPMELLDKSCKFRLSGWVTKVQDDNQVISYPTLTPIVEGVNDTAQQALPEIPVGIATEPETAQIEISDECDYCETPITDMALAHFHTEGVENYQFCSKKCLVLFKKG